MCNQHAASAKPQKAGQYLFYQRCVRHHVVPDTGQLFDFKGNGYLGIDKVGKAIRHLASAYLHRTDLDNTVVYRRETRSFNIEYHVIAVQALSSVPGHDFLQVIHQIGLHPIDDLEEGLHIVGQQHLLGHTYAEALQPCTDTYHSDGPAVQPAAAWNGWNCS